MSQYKQLVQWSASVLREPAEFIRQQVKRMQSAAEELRFGTAGEDK